MTEGLNIQHKKHMLDAQTLKITGTIRAIKLAGWVDQNTKLGDIKVVDMLREAIRTQKWAILSVLQEKGYIIPQNGQLYFEKQNLIATVGRAVVAELLSGGATYTGEINYGSVGTDNTPPTNADTTLGAEVFRKLAASQTFSDNITYIDFFYTASDFDTGVTGTIEEFGNFIDGTGVADSGQLWSHIATGGWTKTGTESLFVSCQYTIN